MQRPDFQQGFEEEGIQRFDGVLAQNGEHDPAGNQRQHQCQ
jgi:hypothetical protein